MMPVAPLGAHPLLLFLLQVGLLLVLAVALGRVAVRFNLPAIVGELSAGVILGPSIFTHLAPGLSGWLFPQDPQQFHLIDAVGQIGVLLLVGITGAHLDTNLIRRQKWTAAKVSGFGLVVPLGIGIGAGFILPAALTGGGHSAAFVLFLGVAVSVSALPVIAKTLMDMNLLHRNIGQLILTAAMIDDAFGWAMLSVVSAMVTTGVHAGTVTLSIVYIIGVVVVMFTAGRPVLRWIFRAAGRSADPAPTIAAMVIVILLCAAGTAALGLEPVFGAFVAGLATARYGKPEPARTAPLRTVTLAVLAPLYFATAGLRMDLTALADPEILGSAGLILALAVIGKFLGAYLGAKTSGLGIWEAVALGAGMNSRGVIEVIVAIVGLRLGVLTPAMFTIILLVAVTTSLLAPPILRFAMAKVTHTAEEEARLVAQNLQPAPTADVA